jgi:hypothetical protein
MSLFALKEINFLNHLNSKIGAIIKVNEAIIKVITKNVSSLYKKARLKYK